MSLKSTHYEVGPEAGQGLWWTGTTPVALTLKSRTPLPVNVNTLNSAFPEVEIVQDTICGGPEHHE